MTPSVTYLLEVRRRLLRVVIFMLAVFIPLFFYANELFSWLQAPLKAHLQINMVAIHLTSPLLVPIELAGKVAMLLTLPYLFYEVWSFLCPALFPHERGLVKKLLISSVGLGLLGLLFCYYCALPMLYGLFTKTLPPGVELLPDISDYLALSTRFFLIFSLIFEVPLVMAFLVYSEFVDVSALTTFRPYYVVSAFFLGMILTPPDVLSQVILALPLCLLYESGLLACRLLSRQLQHQRSQGETESKEERHAHPS